MQDKQGNTALHLASGAPHTDSFSLLLGTQEGRKVASVTNKVNQMPLHVAAARGRAWAVQQLLLLHPQAARSSDKYGRTPLQWATTCGSQVLPTTFSPPPCAIAAGDAARWTNVQVRATLAF